jgi:hypothetical protein
VNGPIRGTARDDVWAGDRHFDGIAWSPHFEGSPWASVEPTPLGDGRALARIYEADAAWWSVFPSGEPIGPRCGSPFCVDAWASGPDDIWLTGAQRLPLETRPGYGPPYAWTRAHWDGRRWTSEDVPLSADRSPPLRLARSGGRAKITGIPAAPTLHRTDEVAAERAVDPDARGNDAEPGAAVVQDADRDSEVEVAIVEPEHDLARPLGEEREGAEASAGSVGPGGGAGERAPASRRGRAARRSRGGSPRARRPTAGAP